VIALVTILEAREAETVASLATVDQVSGGAANDPPSVLSPEGWRAVSTQCTGEKPFAIRIVHPPCPRGIQMQSYSLRRVLRCGLASAILASTACGSDGGTAGIDGSNSGGTHITAKIDGAAWGGGASSFATAVQAQAGAYVISATQTSSTQSITMTISLANIRGPGTYPLGVGPQVPGGSVILATATNGWTSPMSGADGSITITSLSATQIAGTFNFVVSGSAGTRTVTDGDFNVPITTIGTVGALPDNAGSTFSVTLGGAAWNAAFVQGNVTQSSQQGVGSTLTIATTNSTRGVGFLLTGVTGPGTYTLGNTGTVTRQLSVTNVTNSLSNMWSSIGAGASGSVVITSMTASRIKGTFSATLVPSPGSSTTGNLVVTNGAFDVGLP
jgi:hypothetical protein